MLSICIPVYKFDVTELVQNLHLQAEALNVPYEILVVDDASDISFQIKNRTIQQIKGVRYAELPLNVGRAKIRNILASYTEYPWIVFMDCDSALPNNIYLEKYLAVCNDKKIVFGGRSYEPLPPKDNRYFRWYYGVHRESKRADLRSLHPNRSFMTNNFLIARNLMLSMPFDETIALYGHEDTIMGYALKKSGYVIQHIDNPLNHIGLESAEEFIDKTEKGLDNLLYIYATKNKDKEFIADVKVLKYFYWVLISGFSIIINRFYKRFRERMRHNLMGKNPSLFVFDLYKLGYLCTKYEKAISKK